MSTRKKGRLHYFAVAVQLDDGSVTRMRVVATDCIEAIRVAEDLHKNSKTAKRVVNSSAVQQLEPLFQPLTTVN